MIEDIIDNIEAAESYISEAMSSANDAANTASYARGAAENADSVLDDIRQDLSRLEAPDQNKLNAIRENATAIIRLLDS